MTTPNHPFITWHGHDLPLCAPPPDDPAARWPRLPLAHICATLAHVPRFNAAQRHLLPRPEDQRDGDMPRIRIDTRHAWSVAQHLLLCGLLAEAEADNIGFPADQTARVTAAVLVHDVHEAFIGDLITPVVLALPDAAQAAVHNLKTAVDVQLCGYHSIHGTGVDHIDAPPDILARCMREIRRDRQPANIARIDRVSLQIERATLLDWNEARNRPWFDYTLKADATHTALAVVATSGFQRLRHLQPAEAAAELATAITHAADALVEG